MSHVDYYQSVITMLCDAKIVVIYVCTNITMQVNFTLLAFTQSVLIYAINLLSSMRILYFKKCNSALHLHKEFSTENISTGIHDL